MDTNTILTICEAIAIICYLVILITIFRLKEENEELRNENKELIHITKESILRRSYLMIENKNLKEQLATERKKLHALQDEYFNDKELAVKLEESAEKFMSGLPEGCENDER